MMHAIEILSSGPYNTLYATGFAVVFGLAAWQGWRRGWAPLPWLALLAACVAGGIAGSKLLFFDLGAHGAGEKTILGGMTGGVLALLAVQRFLHAPAAASHVLAPAALLGFATGRLGCFLAGCCFGTPTSLPWGVRYGAGTTPFEAHAAAGLLDPAAHASLAVHPSQLYEAALALLLAAAILRWGARLRSAGGVALAVVVGYGLIRSGVQPFRHATATSYILGLQLVQWNLLLLVAAAAAALAIRERAGRAACAARVGRVAAVAPIPPLPASARGALAAPRAAAETAPALTARTGLVLAAVLALLVLDSGWLTPLERLVLVSASLPAAVLLLRRLRACATPALSTGTLVLVPLVADTVLPRSWYTLGGGAMAGRYETEHEFSPGDDCGPSEFRTHSYNVLGISAGYHTRQAARRGYDIRARLFGGTNRIERVDGAVRNEDVRLRGASLVGSIQVPAAGAWGFGEGSWVGASGGFVAGSMIDESGLPGTRLELAAGMRIGWESLFFDIQYNDHEPAPNPNTRSKVSAGYAFGADGSNVRVGVWEGGGVLLGGQLVTRTGLEIEPYIGVLTDEHTSLYGLTLRQRFGRGARR
jgi:hypothetical protein